MDGRITRHLGFVAAACAMTVVAAPPVDARACEVNITSGGTTIDLSFFRIHRVVIGAAGFCYDDTESVARSTSPYVCRMDADVVNNGSAIPPVLAAAMVNDPIEDYCHAEAGALQFPRCAQWYVEATITASAAVYDYEDDYPVVCAPL